jgi:hypothetical protein
MSKPTSDTQSKFIAEGKRDSCIDPAVPLFLDRHCDPIEGPTVAAWFKNKHARGDIGRFYPLHLSFINSRR